MSALSLDEAKSHLNLTSDVDDGELAATIEAAEAAIAQRVGPLEPTEVTSTVYASGRSLTLPVTPVLSLSTAAGEYAGTSFDLTTIDFDGEAGVVQFSPVVGGVSCGTHAYRVPYSVTYIAGRTDCPDDLLYAVKEMVRHLWRTQRGPASLPGQGGADTATPGYLIPNAVAELLEPHMTIGFA